MNHIKKAIIVKDMRDLELPDRVYRALIESGIDSLSKFEELNWDEVEKIKGIGMSSQINIMSIQKKIKKGTILIYGSKNHMDYLNIIGNNENKSEKQCPDKPNNQFTKKRNKQEKRISENRNRITVVKELDDLGLKTGICTSLKNAGIDTIEKFRELNWDSVEKIKGIGMNSQIEIMAIKKRIEDGKIIVKKEKSLENQPEPNKKSGKEFDPKEDINVESNPIKTGGNLHDPVSDLIWYIDVQSKNLNKKPGINATEAILSLKRIITDGKVNNTYKMALARSIIELSSRYDYTDDPIRISVRDVSEDFLRYYWDQTIFFDYAQSSSRGNTPVIIQHVKALILEYKRHSHDLMPRRFEEVESYLRNELEDDYKRTLSNIYYTIPKDVAYRFTTIDGRSADEVLTFDKDMMTFKIRKSVAEQIKKHSEELLKLVFDRWRILLLSYNESSGTNRDVLLTDEELAKIASNWKIVEDQIKIGTLSPKESEEKKEFRNFEIQNLNDGKPLKEDKQEKAIKQNNVQDTISDLYKRNNLAEKGFSLDEKNRVIEKYGIKISSADGVSYIARFNSSNIHGQDQFDFIKDHYGIAVYYSDASYSDEVKWNVDGCKKTLIVNSKEKAYFICKGLDKDKAMELMNYFYAINEIEDKKDKKEINTINIARNDEEKKLESKEPEIGDIEIEKKDMEICHQKSVVHIEPDEEHGLTEIIKYNPLKIVKPGKDYVPAFIVINKKIYRSDNWHDILKILMHYHCYKTDNMELIKSLADRTGNSSSAGYIRSEKWVNESRFFAKFAPEYYLRVVQNNIGNYKMLDKIHHWIGDFELYVIRRDLCVSNKDNKELIESKIDELKKECNYKNGSTRRLVAGINSRILNEKEKYFLRIEREFDRVILIGDIETDNDEEQYLKDYMKEAIEYVLKKGVAPNQEKVFAYGMVRAAIKHYSSNRFWPYVEKEYDVIIPANYQSRINSCFREILLRNGKAYSDEESQYYQNVCMHAFVCNKCANQLFDFIFEFWKIDLSRSIENMKDDHDNNRFDILISEISSNSEVNVQEVMLHTTMALKMNPRGCKNRFRRILNMIDRSYWNNADYSQSRNRLTVLFTKWVNDKNSLFYREYRNSFERRKHGRGERLLSKPSIFFDSAERRFRMQMPKQILRNCLPDEHPVWHISINGIETNSVEPELLQGKASIYTNDCFSDFSEENLYERIDISLFSHRTNYYKWVINASECRFFNSKGRQIDYDRDYISKDTCIAFVKKGYQLRYLSGSFNEEEILTDQSRFYAFEASDGDVFILPNGHALPVGIHLEEGVIGSGRASGVHAIYRDEMYEIVSGREKVFFKATKNQLNGTSIKIFKNGLETYFGKIGLNEYVEFKLDDQTEDIYGYLIDLRDYVENNGVYKLEISIPNSKTIRSSFCYIEKFKYRFEGAPYIFEDAGKICFPKRLAVRTDKNWEIDAVEKSLSFKIDEQLEKQYIKDRKLLLRYDNGGDDVLLLFDLPVLYWKYDSDAEWEFNKPMDVNLKNAPKRIYVDGYLDLSSAKMYVVNDDDLEESEVRVTHTEDGNYFRMLDIVGNLNRNKQIRALNISVDGKDTEFNNIICKSRVESKNITGDFKTNKIYGNYDIIGNSEYSVTVYFEGEKIEEDVPVIDGRFEIEGRIREGKYTIELFEIEEDDSGFDSVYYSLDKEDLMLTDPENLERKTILLRRIRYGGSKFAPIKLINKYWIFGLQKLDYFEDVYEKIDFCSWLYESNDSNILSKFAYYKGIIAYKTEEGLKKLGEALIIFDNAQNSGDVIILILDETSYVSLIYAPTRGSLLVDDSILTKYERKKAKVLDDDKYRFEIEIGANE